MKTSMTIAQEILKEAANDDKRLMSCEAYDLAEQQYTDIDQIWDEEATVYIFEDGSKLKFSENRVELV
jgi:hypothetical protein